MPTLIHDLRFALRALRKSPGFLLAAVVTLGLGIGANTVIFSSVNAMLFKPVAFARLARLVMVWDREPARNVERGAVSAADFLDWKRDAQSFEQLVAYGWWEANLSDVGAPEHVGAAVVSPAFFHVLSVNPARGRAFLEEEGERGRDRVVVLSHGLWHRRYGGDPGLLGRTIRLDHQDFTVVGIMPDGFDFPTNPALWTPLSLGPREAADRASRYLTVIGCLKPGVSLAGAQHELSAVTAGLERAYPKTNTGHTAGVMPLRQGVVDEFSPSFLALLMGAVAFVLLIACANVAGLALAKGAARRKEIAIRLAVGASRSHVVRQLMTESVVLAFLGGAVGLLVAVWGNDALKQTVPVDVRRFIPGWKFIGLDATVLVFTTLLSLLTGLLFGVTPALEATRVSLTDSLKEGGRVSGSGGGDRVRKLLVISEVALALVLLVGAILMVQGFSRIAEPKQGFDSRGVLTLRLALADAKDTPGSAASKDQVRRFYRDVLAHVAGVPGVRAAGLTSRLPWGGGRAGVGVRVQNSVVERESDRPRTAIRVVSPGYFSTLRVPLGEGRDFDDRDEEHSGPVAIVSEALARRISSGSPIGLHLRLEAGPTDTSSLRVVGVVGDIERGPFDRAAVPTTYLTYLQYPVHSVRLAIRTEVEPISLLPSVRAAIAAVDPEQPAFDAMSMRKKMDDQISGVRVAAQWMALLGLAALLLAGIGIYGVVAHGVVLRTHEIGVRIAVGARPGDVVRLVVWQGAKLALLGLAVGLPAAWGISGLMRHTFVGIVTGGPPTFVLITTLLFAVVLAASWLPALKATRVDPMVALRAE